MYRQICAFWKVLAQQAIGTFVCVALPRIDRQAIAELSVESEECGSHRKTSISVASVNFSCPAISDPWSEVSERYSYFGSLRDCLINA